MNANRVITMLGLAPMEHEGGFWTQTWRDEHSTAIYFLMTPHDFSALHRLEGPELWHHYAGAAVEMLLLEPSGEVSRPVLGDDLANGQRPMVAVPAGGWMGAATSGDWSLVGTTMAPGFDAGGFELGDAGQLAATYPEAADGIARLTRSDA